MPNGFATASCEASLRLPRYSRSQILVMLMIFRTLKMMRRAIALLNSTPPSGTEDICKTPHQRVHFERAEMKCNQRRGQIKYLQHNKVGSCCQDIGDLHLFGVLKPERVTVD